MHMSCADESNKLMMLAWKHRQSCSCRNTGANDSPIVTEELTKKKGGSATQIVKLPNYYRKSPTSERPDALFSTRTQSISTYVQSVVRPNTISYP